MALMVYEYVLEEFGLPIVSDDMHTPGSEANWRKLISKHDGGYIDEKGNVHAVWSDDQQIEPEEEIYADHELYSDDEMYGDDGNGNYWQYDAVKGRKLVVFPDTYRFR